MSSVQAGITTPQDGQQPSSGRGTKTTKNAPEKIHPQRELKSHLEKTARFIKAFDILVRAFAWVTCMLAAWLLACVVDHWLLPLPIALRWLIWAALVAFTTWIAIWQIAPLIVGRINPDYAAARIERAEPQFKEGLIAWLQLSEMPDSGVPRGVMAALTYRAYRFIGGQDPSSTVDSSPLVRGLAGFLVLSCVMALYSFVSPKSSLATATRIAMPWRTVAAPTRVKLSEVVPGTTIVSAGKPLEVSVRAVGVRRGEPVHLVFSTRDGQIVSQAIPLTEPDVGSIYKGLLTTTGSGIEHELKYWIEAGDAITEQFNIHLAPTPSVVLQQVELVYPAYTKLPKQISDGRDVETIEGTVATVVARSNQDLVRGQLEVDPTQDPNGFLRTADRTLQMDVNGRQLKRDWQPELREGQITRSVRYSVRGFNARGDSNQHPIEHSLTVVADVPPEIRLVGPKNRILRVHPTSRIQLEIRASDPDFGLNEVELSVHKSGASVASRVVLKGDGLKGKQVKRQPLDIGRLSMSAGDRLELHAAARDNRHDPASGKWAPNETHADPLVVEVVSPDQPSDVPSGNQDLAPNGEPGSDGDNPDANDNPRPSGSDSGDRQPGGQSQDGSKAGSSNQDQNGNEASGKSSQENSSDGGQSGKQSGSSGGAGSSSDESGDAESTSEQSGGAGGSSSNSDDSSQQNGNSAGGSSSSSSSSDNSNSEQQSQAGGSSSSSQDSASKRPSNGASENSSSSENGSSAQSQGNSRAGAGGSPESDAQAMKQVEQFMREKGEQSAQQRSASGPQAGNPSGGQPQRSQSSDPQDTDANRDAGANNGQSQQRPESGKSGEQSSNSGSDASTQDGQTQTGSENQQPGENKSSQSSAGENADNQNGGENSSKQNGDQPNSGQNNAQNNTAQANQDNSSSAKTGQSNSKNPSAGSSGEKPGSSSDSGGSSKSGESQGSESQGSKSQGSEPASDSSSAGQPSGGQSGDDSQGSQSGKGQSASSDPAASSGANTSSEGKSGEQGGGEQQSDPSDAPSGKGKSDTNQSPSKSPDGQKSGGQENGGEQSGGQGSGGETPGAQDSGKQQPNTKTGKEDPKSAGASNQEQSGSQPNGSQPSGSQPSGSQPNGQQQSSSSEGGPQSQSGTSSSDSGNSSNSTGSSSNNGSSDRTGGGPGQVDAADKEAAAKAADMVLDYLDRQRDQPDPDLLREINWNKNDLNSFVDRWKQARDLASQGDNVARENWEELLSALNLSGKRSGSLGPMKRSDDFQQMSDSAIRVQPPKSLLKRWEAVQRALEKR